MTRADGYFEELLMRVLAHVPHWATGFIVRTMNLEAWDLGTVFGVAVSNTVSELFVFKGSV